MSGLQHQQKMSALESTNGDGAKRAGLRWGAQAASL